MTRSGEQPVDLDHPDVAIEVPTATRLLLQLRSPKRLPTSWWTLLSTLVFFPFAALFFAYGPSPNYKLASFMAVAGMVSLFLQIRGHESEQRRERDRVVAELLEELVAQNNQQRRDLERLARASGTVEQASTLS